MTLRPELLARLEGYRGEGSLDSSGSFTLSEARAEEKLREFRHPEPRLYVLNLQAAMVAGGASWVDFHGDSDDLILESDCLLPDATLLEQLHSLVFSTSAPAVFRELGIGLSGAQVLDPRILRVEGWDGKRGAVLESNGKKLLYQGEQARPAPSSTRAEVNLRVHVRERVGLRTARKFLTRISGGMAPDSEEDAVFRHCNRSPVPVTFNGTAAVRPLLLGSGRTVAFNDGADLSHHPLGQLEGLEWQDSTGPFRGILAVGGKLPPWVTLVLHGVNFRLPGEAFGAKKLRGVVYLEHLKKDLSQCQLVQDHSFLAVIDELIALAAHL